MGKSWRKGAFFKETVSGTPTSVDILVTDSERRDPCTFIVQIYRAGVDVKEDAVITYDTNTKLLTIANGGATFAFADGDVIHASVSFGEKE